MAACAFFLLLLVVLACTLPRPISCVLIPFGGLVGHQAIITTLHILYAWFRCHANMQHVWSNPLNPAVHMCSAPLS